MKNKYLLFGLCILFSILLIGRVEGVCNTTANNQQYTLTTNLTLCTGTYYNVTFLPAAHNITIDGNGSTIYANVTNISHWTTIDLAYYGKHNITIKNITLIGMLNTSRGIYIGDNTNVTVNYVSIRNYSVDIEIDNGDFNYVLINNSNISGATGCLANLGVYSGRYVSLVNSHFDNSLNLTAVCGGAVKPHGVYVTPQTGKNVDNFYVDNCTFNNNGGEGLHINGEDATNYNNFTIQNSFFTNNGDYGMDIQGLSNSIVQNNYLSNNPNFGIGFGTGNFCLPTTNTTILNNTFYNNTNADIISIKNNLNLTVNDNISIINNTFSSYFGSVDTLNIKISYITGINFNGNITPNFRFQYSGIHLYCGNARLNTSYNGRIQFRDINCTINITNQLSQYPYNDVKNITGGFNIVNNTDNYSIIMSLNSQYAVGDYTPGYSEGCIPFYANLGYDIVCSLTSCSFPGTSCTGWT